MTLLPLFGTLLSPFSNFTPHPSAIQDSCRAVTVLNWLRSQVSSDFVRGTSLGLIRLRWVLQLFGPTSLTLQIRCLDLSHTLLNILVNWPPEGRCSNYLVNCSFPRNYHDDQPHMVCPVQAYWVNTWAHKSEDRFLSQWHNTIHCVTLNSLLDIFVNTFLFFL